MRTLTLTLALFTALILAGCGGGGRKAAAHIPPVMGETAHLRGSIQVSRADAKWFIGVVSIENIGEKPIEFPTSYGLPQSPIFRLSASGAPDIGANHGMWQTSQAAYLQHLPPKGRLHMELKWRHLYPPQPGRGYPWTMSVTGMRVDGEAIPDLVLRHP